ncbi:MAG: hypothetical protein SPL15_06940 [Lachnospiraceae bacterium]|nr:hypothetical protein [Lachnospiraceae bacterium]
MAIIIFFGFTKKLKFILDEQLKVLYDKQAFGADEVPESKCGVAGIGRQA